MHESAADRPAGPEPTISTSTSWILSRDAGRGRRPVLAMCSMAARPRFDEFFTSGLPAASPIR